MRYRIIYMCSVYLPANMEATEPMVSSTKSFESFTAAIIVWENV